MPAIATETLITLFHFSAPTSHLQVEYNINYTSRCHQYYNGSVVLVLSTHVVRTTLVLIYSFYNLN
jgi:hypothetical protein